MVPPPRRPVRSLKPRCLGALAALLIAGTLGLPPQARPLTAPTTSSPGLGKALGPSNASQLQLSDHLRQQGFLFYGAWWCPACFRQKSLFGEEAGQRLPYVECDREETGRQRCSAADIRAYPTWVRGSERREGVQSLEELARWSGWSNTSR